MLLWHTGINHIILHLSVSQYCDVCLIVCLFDLFDCLFVCLMTTYLLVAVQTELASKVTMENAYLSKACNQIA